MTLKTAPFLTIKLKLQATCTFYFMCKHISLVVESQFMYGLQVLQRFQIAKVTFKLTQSRCQSYHSIGHMISYLFVFYCNYVSILHHFRDITYFPKFEDVT